MAGSGKELEVKFCVADLKALQARLEALGACMLQARVHEINLRFDTPQEELRNSGRLLRLRQDTAAHVTYKGPGEVSGGARLRQELEFTVDDFHMAQALFEALGYQVSMMYEKYRTTYKLGELVVTLDEMPYGSFAEIEGPDGESIQAAAGQLGLDWERRNLESYTILFENARQVLGFSFRDLSFANFKGLEVTPQDLGVLQAD
jgi:adenylate cyclase class 2